MKRQQTQNLKSTSLTTLNRPQKLKIRSSIETILLIRRNNPQRNKNRLLIIPKHQMILNKLSDTREQQINITEDHRLTIRTPRLNKHRRRHRITDRHTITTTTQNRRRNNRDKHTTTLTTLPTTRRLIKNIPLLINRSQPDLTI